MTVEKGKEASLANEAPLELEYTNPDDLMSDFESQMMYGDVSYQDLQNMPWYVRFICCSCCVF